MLLCWNCGWWHDSGVGSCEEDSKKISKATFHPWNSCSAAVSIAEQRRHIILMLMLCIVVSLLGIMEKMARLMSPNHQQRRDKLLYIMRFKHEISISKIIFNYIRLAFMRITSQNSTVFCHRTLKVRFYGFTPWLWPSCNFVFPLILRMIFPQRENFLLSKLPSRLFVGERKPEANQREVGIFSMFFPRFFT